MDESELAQKFREACEGDRSAYALFLEEISRVIRGIIRAKAGGLQREEQEDILQNVLMAIHIKRATWRQDHPVKPWVYAIARYKIVDALRARGRAVMLDISDFTDKLETQEQDTATTIDVEQLVGRLSGKQGEVVRMISVEGLAIADVAEKLNMSQGAVRVNFHRGLETLRSWHEEEER